MRVPDLLWVILIGAIAVAELVTLVRGELEMRRLHRRWGRLKEPSGSSADALAMSGNSADALETVDFERLLTERLARWPERGAELMRVLKPMAAQSTGPRAEKLRNVLAQIESRQEAERRSHAAQVPLTLRPKAVNSGMSTPRLISVFAVIVLVFAVVLGQPIYRRHPGLALILDGIAVGLSGLYLLRRWRYLAQATLFIDSTQVGMTASSGRQRAVNRAAVASVYLSKQSVVYYHGSQNIRRMFLVGQDRQALLRVNGTYWSMDDMVTLAATLGVPLEGSWSTDETGDQLRRKVLGSIKWRDAHPNLFWTLVMIIVVPLVIIGLVALSSG